MALYHNARGSVNYTVIGSPTIVNGVASGFSSSNYLKFSSQFSVNQGEDFEFFTKIKINNLPDTSYLFGFSNDSVGYGVGIVVFNNGQVGFRFFALGGFESSQSLSLNTDYYIKVGRKDGVTYIGISQDKNTWAMTYGSSANMNNAWTPDTSDLPVIGRSQPDTFSYAGQFDGSIDLNETYISVNGQPWFGVSPVEVKKVVRQGGSPAEVSGVDSLSLPNAKANSLTEVTLYGAAEQSGTPTPTTPVDIVCNNGALKVNSQGQIYTDGTTETVEITGKNLFDKTAVITGKSININGVEERKEDTSISDYISVIPGQTYIRSLNGVAYGNTYFTYDKNKTFIATYQPGSGIPFTIVSGVSYIRFNIVNTNLDTYQFEKGSTATTYEPYFNGGTATAQPLYKVGTYQDVQSVIDGVVTRNVGIKVLDGTETVTKTTSTAAPLGYYFGVETGTPHKSNVVFGFCTNFTVTANQAQTLSNNTFALGSSQRIWFATSKFTEASDFQQWLATQYAQGTPVIVVYPLATATTESVTAQTLNVQEGNNTLSVTQASMSDLGMSAKYTETTASDVKYVVKDDKLVFADQRLYLTGPVNYTKVGSPTIVDGVLTSASSNDYVQTTRYTLQGTETIEFVLKIKPKLGITGYHSGVGGIVIPNDYNMVSVGAFNEGYGYVFRLLCAYSMDWGADFIFSETTTLGPNDWFWTRIVLDCANNTIAAYYSYDGSTWTLKDTKTISNGYAFVGKTIGYQGQLFDGSTKILEAIDLNNTYVKINGSLLFYGKNYASKNIAPVPANYTYGTTTTSAIGYVDMRTQAFTAAPSGATLKLDDYGEPWQCTRVGGSVHFLDYGIVEGFYNNDYFYTNNTLDTSKDFEICLACRPQYQSWTILGVNSQGTETSGFVMSLEDEQKYCLFTTDNDGQEGAIIRGSQVAWNTPTLIKFSQVGKTVKLETSTDDGATWTLQGSGQMRTYCRKTTGVSFGGGWYGGYLNGDIDLNKTYIMTDGVKHRLVLNI